MSDENQKYKVQNLVGVPTDYSDENNWAHLPENADKAVDTFFIYPTLYFNPNPTAPTIVPVDDSNLRAAVKFHYIQAPILFEDMTNVYEPFYRQSNLCALAGKDHDELVSFQRREQRTDVYAALDYFFENYNEGRPFILAGHSQGSEMIRLALCDYFKEHTEYLERMVAAYAIGFSITSDDLKINPALKFAEGADDTGVIVSWNTEGPENKNEESAVVLENAISINPINWKRDDTYAPASENKGDLIPVTKSGSLEAVDFNEHKPGLADAQIDLERGVVVCTTLSDEYVTPLAPGVPNIFGPASLHMSDYPAFWENIRENIKTRIDAFFE
ncbi:MAG: DUF3089 domain-containing protein [Methanobrevibacter sp.]|nr:DUF3089 domain-containing protein [Methanobrevibacter sp.]